MARTARTAAVASIATLAAVAAIIAVDLTALASASLPPTCAGYIVAQRLEDGRVQVVWEDRGRPSWWVVPNQRYFPADAQVGRWLYSSRIRYVCQLYPLEWFRRRQP